MVDRLEEDHRNALRLAEGIDGIDGLSIDRSAVRTNIVYFTLAGTGISGEDLLTRLGEKGVKTLLTGPNTFRMVTHYGITENDITDAVSTLREAMQ